MNKKQYMEFHEACCRKMVEITKKKNADYTGVGDDPFANFSRVESLGICTVIQGFLVRMTDKLCRIASFSAKGFLEVLDESVEDTLLDLANYCILLAGYIRQDRQKVTADAAPPRKFENQEAKCSHPEKIAAEGLPARCTGCGKYFCAPGKHRVSPKQPAGTKYANCLDCDEEVRI